MAGASASVVITAHNEGSEVARTIESVSKNTSALREIILVDDASTDGSCDYAGNLDVRVLRHHRRIGIAYSRDEASRCATGDVFCYLDAHQRVSNESIDRCGALALAKNAIVVPTIKGTSWTSARLYGATFCLCPEKGYFSAKWVTSKRRARSRPLTSLKAPAYFVPRSVYDTVGWGRQLRGWGGSEALVSLKAFFRNVPIVSCHSALVRHRFRRRAAYEITWGEVWRNQALIARICFEESTWRRHWLPNLFSEHLSDDVLHELESKPVLEEHAQFQAVRRRSDREFWTELLRSEVPTEVN